MEIFLLPILVKRYRKRLIKAVVKNGLANLFIRFKIFFQSADEFILLPPEIVTGLSYKKLQVSHSNAQWSPVIASGNRTYYSYPILNGHLWISKHWPTSNRPLVQLSRLQCTSLCEYLMNTSKNKYDNNCFIKT